MATQTIWYIQPPNWNVILCFLDRIKSELSKVQMAPAIKGNWAIIEMSLNSDAKSNGNSDDHHALW